MMTLSNEHVGARASYGALGGVIQRGVLPLFSPPICFAVMAFYVIVTLTLCL